MAASASDAPHGQDGAGADLLAATHDGSASRAPGLLGLLRDVAADWPNQIWCGDLTYIPMRRGFLYLVMTARCAEASRNTYANSGDSGWHFA